MLISKSVIYNIKIYTSGINICDKLWLTGRGGQSYVENFMQIKQ